MPCTVPASQNCCSSGLALMRVRFAGLLYDDLIIETPTVTLALQRLSEEERQARWRRIKRAIDLDVKHATIPVADQVCCAAVCVHQPRGCDVTSAPHV